uniref:Uncharacterized protein n=1 Tax=Alexandrium monilatum TaxID=311494 RepID=A0A7S4QBR6_9DINO
MAVTPIAGKLYGDGTGRDGYIIRDKEFVHGAAGAHHHPPDGSHWYPSLRDYATPRKTGKEAAGFDPAGPCVEIPNGAASRQCTSVGAVPCGPCVVEPTRTHRRGRVPIGGAPRAVVAPGPRGGPPLTPRRAEAVPLWVEQGRALWGLQEPGGPYIDRRRHRAARMERNSCGSSPQPTSHFDCQAPKSTTAARAAVRAAGAQARAASEMRVDALRESKGRTELRHVPR